MTAAEIVPGDEEAVQIVAAPDESYSVAEAAAVLQRGERQVLRYLTSGRLRGSQASGRWTVTALHIWQFLGIADEMLESWRTYARAVELEHKKKDQYQRPEKPGE